MIAEHRRTAFALVAAVLISLLLMDGWSDRRLTFTATIVLA